MREQGGSLSPLRGQLPMQGSKSGKRLPHQSADWFAMTEAGVRLPHQSADWFAMTEAGRFLAETAGRVLAVIGGIWVFCTVTGALLRALGVG